MPSGMALLFSGMVTKSSLMRGLSSTDQSPTLRCEWDNGDRQDDRSRSLLSVQDLARCVEYPPPYKVGDSAITVVQAMGSFHLMHAFQYIIQLYTPKIIHSHRETFILKVPLRPIYHAMLQLHHAPIPPSSLSPLSPQSLLNLPFHTPLPTQPPKHTPLLHQFLRSPHLLNPPLLQHHDAITIQNGINTMRNSYDRSIRE
jgi:hypothetical protein